MVKTELAQNSRDKILAAAQKVFLQKGMAGARMQDIADVAGMNKALLHYYFRSKEKLFETIFKEALSKLFPRIEYILDSDLPLFEKIERFCGEYMTMIYQNPFLPLFILNEVTKQPQRFKERFWKNREPIFFKFVLEVELEIKKKKIKLIDPAQLFLNMLSLCIFPIIAKPMWMISTPMTETQMQDFMEKRKTEVPKFIIESIKK